MPDFFLFETTESILEALWDIALVLLLTQISLVYFSLTLVTWVLLSWCLHEPAPPALSPFFVGPTLQLLAGAFWSLVVVRYYELPRQWWFRLVFGALAGCFLLAAETVAALALPGDVGAAVLAPSVWIGSTTDRIMSVAVLVGTALLPLLLSVGEGKRDQFKQYSSPGPHVSFKTPVVEKRV
ncbi:hypothetical protein BX600DRAFT_467409 [Xylariales sp. PMI_506]|nr:hypothetical protein BX600DRAFT_467409 [Xylariales sp. PMI_506]